MQQLQEKLTKVQQNSIEERGTFTPSPLPTVLSTAGKVFYGLAGASMAASLFAWNRVILASGTSEKKPRGSKKNVSVKPNHRQTQESQRLGTYIGLWTPTFVVAGHALEYAGERLARHEYTQWEKKQGNKAYAAEFRAHYYNR